MPPLNRTSTSPLALAVTATPLMTIIFPAAGVMRVKVPLPVRSLTCVRLPTAKLTTLTGRGLGAATFNVLVEQIGNVPDAITGSGLAAFIVTVLISVTGSGFGAAMFSVLLEVIGNAPDAETGNGF